MKLSTIVSAIILATTIQAPLQALACTAPISNTQLDDSNNGMTSSSPWTAALSSGNYAFSGAHSAGSSFFEELTFSLTTVSDVTIGIVDVGAVPVTTLMNASATQFSNLLSNKYLTLSLFDNSGKFLDSAGAGGTLTALNLAAGGDYVLTVSGKASGVYGGMYAGNLSVAAVSEVPLGETAPLLGSALLVLMARVRKFRKTVIS